jgi:arabinogalactan endo-1,4-beta-galactosidase
MRRFKYSIASGFASICILGLAAAADITDMTGAEIQSLISGRTGYVKTAPASVTAVTGKTGEGVIYWGADGNSVYKTPAGPIWHGSWSIKGNLYCSEYKEGSKRPCMKVEKQGDTVNFVDTESGQLRLTVVKTVPGNAENLN